MNLQQVYNEAMKLLGYTNQDGVIDNDNSRQEILTIGNAVLVEITPKSEEFTRLSSITEEIPLSQRIITDCYVYGVAMWLALHSNDGDNQQFFASLYEQKKHNLISYEEITDIFEGEV